MFSVICPCLIISPLYFKDSLGLFKGIDSLDPTYLLIAMFSKLIALSWEFSYVLSYILLSLSNFELAFVGWTFVVSGVLESELLAPGVILS